jgi:mannose-6-phosphate isomerase-like protein (cupin superfamily)
VLRGAGWALVDEEQVAVRPGQFIGVTPESARQVRAGGEGPSSLRRARMALTAPPFTACA